MTDPTVSTRGAKAQLRESCDLNGRSHNLLLIDALAGFLRQTQRVEKSRSKKPTYLRWDLAWLFLLIPAAYKILKYGFLGQQKIGSWDTKIYFFAGKDIANGVNPYLQLYDTHTGKEWVLPYLYPPYINPLARLLSSIRIDLLPAFWLLAKVSCILGLLGFFKKRCDFDFLQIALLIVLFGIAFHGCLPMDLWSGNISTFELVPLSLGLWCAIQKRFAESFILLITLSVVKVAWLPLSLLPFLLLQKDSQYPWRSFICASTLFLVLQLTTFALNPPLYLDYLRGAAKINEIGKDNPCLRAVFSQLIGLKFANLYLLIAVPTLFYVREKSKRLSLEVRAAVLLLALTLLVPRLKDYSHVLIVPAAFLVLRNRGRILLPILGGMTSMSLLFSYGNLVNVYALILIGCLYPDEICESFESVHERTNPPPNPLPTR